MADLSNLLAGQSNLVTTQMLATVATSGNYADLSNKPVVISLKGTSVTYPGNDLAVDTAGAQTILITGTGFESTPTVYVGGTIAPSVTFVSSTQITFTTPAKTAGTYDVYIVNPGGATAIMVMAISYSGFPTWTTAAGSLGTLENNWTVQLQATSNSAVTYALTSGSTLPSGVTLSSSGLITGTNLSVEQTFNFSVTATDAELQDTPRSFSVTISLGEPYFRNVTVLLSADISTTPFNKDSSTNNAEILVAGNTKTDDLTPYSGNPTYGSVYFNGNTDYLKVPNSGLFGSGDWTIEFWVRSPAGQSDKSIIEARNSAGGTGSSNGFTLTLITGSEIRLWSAGEILRGSVTYVNQWAHVAVTKSSGTTKMYLNGVSVGTSTALGNMSDTEFHVATGYYGSTSLNTYTNMYISDLRVVKGSAVYSTNFTPPTTPLTAITNTVLLTAQFKGQPNNNAFKDSSVNNFAITRVGNVSQGSFSPYGSNWSNYIDGSSYLAISNGGSSAFDMGTGNCTIEMWVNPDTQTTSFPSMFAASSAWSTGTFYIRYSNTGSSNKFGIFWNSVGDPFLASTNTYPSNAWYHVALVRNGTTFTLYVNGVADGTGTSSASLNLDIGGSVWLGNNGSPSCNFKGYLSNVRVVKGTAVYTSNFTPSTTPLTAVSGTSLLTCQSNRFKDSSANNFAITANGTPSVQRFNPFGASQVEYSAATIGGSGYFDGSVDSLVAPNNSVFAFGTGDFTIETWIYLNTTSPTYQGVVDNRPSGGASANAFLIYIAGGGTLYYFSNSTNILSSLIKINTWTHVAVTRSSGSLRLFINGTISGSAVSDSINLTETSFVVGNTYDSSGLNGYMSNVRLVKGTAVYTSNFTPPTAPVTAISGTSLLLNMTNGTIIDNAMQNNFETVGSAQISTAIKKYGTGSLYFNGSSYLTAADSPNFELSNSDWTMEAWIYPTSTGNYPVIAAQYNGGADNSFFFSLGDNSRSLDIYLYTASTNPSIIATNAITLNTWQHVAAVRSSNVVTLYANGISVGSMAFSGLSKSSSQPLTVGNATNIYPFFGYIDDFRFTKGFARYTANFTPPTVALKTK
jgi:hypothetical protein